MLPKKNLLAVAVVSTAGLAWSTGPVRACNLDYFYSHEWFRQLEVSYPACGADWYEHASLMCKRVSARVCTYEDFYAIYAATPWAAYFNPNGKWIGNMVGDDDVLCGNKDVTYDGDPDVDNFEGVCNKHDAREYFCCRDTDR
jgi:hypothetical protein